MVGPEDGCPEGILVENLLGEKVGIVVNTVKVSVGAFVVGDTVTGGSVG